MKDEKKLKPIVDPCVHCGESTAFGSGRFVNRVGADDGWSCSECLCFQCDRCRERIAFNEDICPEQCGLEEFLDGSDRICEECMNPTERKQARQVWEAHDD